MNVLKRVMERESQTFVQTNTNNKLHTGLGSKSNDKTFQIFHSMDVKLTDTYKHTPE